MKLDPMVYKVNNENVKYYYLAKHNQKPKITKVIPQIN